jgi:RNA ligase
MTTKNPPYQHANGDNCWTKNCKIRLREEAVRDAGVNKISRAEFFTPAQKIAPAKPLPPFSSFMKAAEDGRVNARYHETEPYVTFKYSQVTQFSRDWDDVTMASRGIIFNKDTGEVVARPFAKFFNHNEPNVDRTQLRGPISVTEKLDGSLGIGYTDSEGRMNIATGGSFISEQSKHATEIYRDRYEGNWEPNPELTYMWEIIGPENRVVVDYGDTDDIHLIGAVNKETGRSVLLRDVKEWKWEKAPEYNNLKSLDAVVNSPERPNHEGFIVHYTDTDTRVKFKHAEYLEHHRTATGVTSRTIWKMMRTGEDMEAWKQTVPEEFLGFIEKRQNRIQKALDTKIADVTATHKKLQATLPAGYKPVDFINALKASDIPAEERGYMQGLEFRGAVTTAGPGAKSLWESIKPEPDKTFWNHEGDDDK